MPGKTQQENPAEILSKGFLNAIKGYGDLQQTQNEIQGRRMKLETDMLAHKFQAEQNFFWKMKEKNEQTDYQKKLSAQFDAQNAQQPGAPGEDSSQEVFGQKPTPSIVMGSQGYQVKTPEVGPKLWMQLLQKKMEKGIKEKNNQFAYFTPREKVFFDKATGMAKDSSMDFLGGGSEMPSPRGSEQPATESPYAEYPDAVLEDGVWKVIREGKKYRLEE